MPRGKAAGGSAAAKKPKAAAGHQLAEKFPSGLVMRDIFKKNWILGDVIGQGGFGLIYLASPESDSKVGQSAEYVIKIEPQSNGPLFCELHFYQRVCKPNMIDDWVKGRKLKYLGVPKYIASGIYEYKGKSYRFMVMQRFSTDLQKIFVDAGKRFSEPSVYALGLRMIDALEYMHENDYIHADVKASNCLMGFKNGKMDPNAVYLVDYGLAAKYKLNGDHREYKEDPRKAHDGTVEFTSIDAHKGVGPSRRGDMEILGYCMLQWLCGKLPWEDKLSDKNYVRDSKIRYMSDIPSLIRKCFPHGDSPAELSKYLSTVMSMKYHDKPDYNKLRGFLQSGFTKHGHKDSWKLDLPIGGAKAAPKKASPKKGAKRKSTESGADEPAPKQRAKATPSTPKSPVKRGADIIPGLAKDRLGPPKKSPKRASPKKPTSKPVVNGGVKSPGRAGTPTGRTVIPGAPGSSGSGGPKPKKKVVRRKQVQSSEIGIQTSPGLKKNT